MDTFDNTICKEATIAAGGVFLNGSLVVPKNADGLVVFAHGSGSSWLSPRNRYVARLLNAAGIGTLLPDLLTPGESTVDARTGHLRFDIEFLANRLAAVIDWTSHQNHVQGLPLGLFGASTGAAAALTVAARRLDIAAVVSRGGRPDLAMAYLEVVSAPVLLIVGSEDHDVLQWNREALRHLNSHSHLQVVEGATHLFEEPGTLEKAARLAAHWFNSHFDLGH